MKKLIALITMGTLLIGTAGMSVSADEYTVKEGDNLWNIAVNYNTTMEDLIDINKLNTTIIQPEQKLVVTEEEEEELYVVEQGDTLSGIGLDFNVTVKNIKEWNDLKSDLILVDQELKIEGTSSAQADQVVTSETKAVEAPKEEVQKEAAPEAKAEPQAKAEPKPKAEPKQEASKSEEKPAGKTISVSATAYTAECYGCSGVTATGIDLNKDRNAKVIAVDPNVIPLGSKVHVEGYGTAIAGDTGGAIKGNKIDLHVPTKDEAFSWGVRNVNVTILD